MHHPLHQALPGTLLLKPGSPAGAWRVQQFQGLKAADSVPQWHWASACECYAAMTPRSIPGHSAVCHRLAVCRVHTLPLASCQTEAGGQVTM